MSLCASRAKGTGLYQSAAALFSRRNAQVGFKTECDESLNKHRKFEPKLWLKDAESVAVYDQREKTDQVYSDFQNA